MRSDRLPKCVPVGTKYVIEGKSLGDAEEMHISARYLVFPDGRCLDLPSDGEEPSLRTLPPANVTTH